MLNQIVFPVAALAGMKPAHVCAMAGLLSFADAAGLCWPGLRRLAGVCGMKLSTLQRAIAEMEMLGYLARGRRGQGTLYRIAERFLCRPIRRSASGTGCSASGTEGEAKKEQDSKIKREDPVRRAAPPDDNVVAGDKFATTDSTVSGEPARRRHAEPAEGPNPHARRQWLKKLNAFISERLSGPQQWLGWELIARAEQGALIDRAERRQLDAIDRAMRGCGYRPN